MKEEEEEEEEIMNKEDIPQSAPQQHAVRGLWTAVKRNERSAGQRLR